MKYRTNTLVILSILFILSASCSNETSNGNSPNNLDRCEKEGAIKPDSPLVLENPKQLNPSANAVLYDIGLSTDGQGLIIWSTDTDTPSQLYANSIDILGSATSTIPLWGEPIRVDAGINDAVSNPAFSMEACGNAILTWNQGGKSWYRNYSTETGWTKANEIDSGPACISLSINRTNTAFCIYYEKTDGYYAVYSRNYNIKTGWSLPERIDQPTELDAHNTSIKVDSDGNAIAIWQQTNPDYTDTYLGIYKEKQINIWANKYISGRGWAGAVVIENLDKWHSVSPKLAMDMDGNAYVAWISYDRPSYLGDAKTSVYFNKFSIIDGWSNEQLLSGESEINTNNISLSVNNSGRGVVTWNSYHWQGLYPPSVKSRQFDEFTLFANSHDVTIGAVWDASTESASFFSGNTNPVTAINDNGLITTVWTSPNWDEQFFINKYTPENDWGDAMLIEGINDAYLPRKDAARKRGQSPLEPRTPLTGFAALNTSNKEIDCPKYLSAQIFHRSNGSL